MSIKNKVCALLWNQMSVGVEGTLRLCCNSYGGNLRNNGKSVSASEYDNLDYLSTLPVLNSIRREMLAGKEPVACNRCWAMEQSGAHSFRNIHNDMFPKTYQRVLAGDTAFKLEYLSLDFGNKCNLACKMCSPGSSSFLAKEQVDAVGFLSDEEVRLAKTVLEKANEKQWYQNENFWLSIQPHLKSLTRLYIIGGEPFIIPEHTKLLELIVEFGHPEAVTICYNSNLTTLPSQLLELWKKFKTIEINASIDGTDQFYEYIRWPVPFKRIEENIQRILDLNMRNLSLGIHCTVQNLNVVNIATLIKRFSNIGIFFIPVDKPNYLHASVLPKHILVSAIEEIRELQKSEILNPGTHFNLVSLIAHLENVLSKHEDDLEVRKHFLSAMSWYDQRRKQSLVAVHPYFEEWIS